LENIICCLNEEESFLRISGHFKDCGYINFEQYVNDLDEVKNMSLYRSWQYAVIDKNLLWQAEAVIFFKKKGITIIYFDDDYGEVIASIKSTINKPASAPGTDSIPEVKDKDTDPVEKIRYIEKQKIIEKKVYTGIEKKTVIVSNLTKCAGSTTLTLNLAKYLSNLNILTAVVEPPIEAPTIFHWVGIEERLNKSAGNKFYSYPHSIRENKTLKPNSEFVFDGIAWIVADDRKDMIIDWNYNQMIKLIYASSLCPITLIDIGSNTGHESVKPILSNVDGILVVVDPFPTYCMKQNHKLEEILKLKQEGFPIHFIVNKYNSGVKDKDFLSFIGCEPLATIPAIELSYLYRANYSSNIVLDYMEVFEKMSAPLEKILSVFIQKKFLKKATEKKVNRSILKRLKNFSLKLKREPN